MSQDPDIFDARINTLNARRALHARRARAFLCEEAFKMQKDGFSIYEVGVIMSLPETRVKKLIEEGKPNGN